LHDKSQVSGLQLICPQHDVAGLPQWRDRDRMHLPLPTGAALSDVATILPRTRCKDVNGLRLICSASEKAGAARQANAM
jgi:hypothetical protein